ncbi:hypothetical protein LguiB_019467 [Lonicera macranthoides]
MMVFTANIEASCFVWAVIVRQYLFGDDIICPPPYISLSPGKNNVASPNQMQNKPTAEGVKTMEDGFVDAFRPTTPGHSPGVGHSKHD